MTSEDIDNIISVICPNDEDFEKACISPAYLKKELEALALEQEPCDDCISRQAVKELYYKDGYIDFRKICELQSVNPQSKTGHWIYSGSHDVEGMLYCSNCKHEIDVSEGYFNFCLNCGAKMVEPQKREDKE